MASRPLRCRPLRGLCGTAGAAELQKVPTAWMGAQETSHLYAKQKGWDKEVGLDVELLYFSSGMDALSTLPAKTWSSAAWERFPPSWAPCATTPTSLPTATTRRWSTPSMVRPDSPILKAKGANPRYPDVYGSADTVRGKLILCPEKPPAHYLLSTWLHILGSRTRT